MKQRMAAVLAALIGPALLGACASHNSPHAVTSIKSTQSPATTNAVPRSPCQAAALALGYGPLVVPMTGEDGMVYALTNRGRVTCTLVGYPKVALYGAHGAALPFHYRHGHGLYVTSAPPVAVIVAPGASAYVLVAKYRCDLGTVRNAATVRLTLPAPQSAALTGRASPTGMGVSTLSYCRGGPNGPGQTIEVSPIERTPGAATSLG
jgi:hypothetical protein